MLNKFTCEVDGETRILAHCNTCGRNSIHTVEAQANGAWGDSDYQGWEEHALVRCGGCDNIKYSATHWDEHDFDYDEDGNAYAVKTPKYFPSPKAKKLDIEHFYNLPGNLYDIFGEVLNSHSNNDLTLSTIGLRLVIELICNNSSCTSKTLFAKINELEKKGVISADEREILQEVRKFGNAGAHAGEAMSSDQIGTAIEICYSVIDKLFIQPELSKKLLAQAKKNLMKSNKKIQPNSDTIEII